MPKILIPGGTGFLGSALARKLALRDDVMILTRNPATFWRNPNPGQIKLYRITGNSTDRDAAMFAELLDGVDIVYNLSGSPGAIESNRDPTTSLSSCCSWNLRFLRSCADSARKPHVVFASSRLVYGKPESLPVTEDHRTMPQSFYAAHKLCVENYHRLLATGGAMTYTVCRISNPFGIDQGSEPSGEYSFLNQLIRSALKGQPLTIFGDGKQLRDYIYVEDLVDALILCGTHPSARNATLNIGSGVGISIAQAAYEVARQTGVEVKSAPWPERYLEIETGDFVNGIEKLQSLLGYRPRWTFDAGITKTVETLSKHGSTTARVLAGAPLRVALSAQS